jgi:hypothetical protein
MKRYDAPQNPLRRRSRVTERRDIVIEVRRRRPSGPIEAAWSADKPGLWLHADERRTRSGFSLTVFGIAVAVGLAIADEGLSKQPAQRRRIVAEALEDGDPDVMRDLLELLADESRSRPPSAST